MINNQHTTDTVLAIAQGIRANLNERGIDFVQKGSAKEIIEISFRIGINTWYASISPDWNSNWIYLNVYSHGSSKNYWNTFVQDEDGRFCDVLVETVPYKAMHHLFGEIPFSDED